MLQAIHTLGGYLEMRVLHHDQLSQLSGQEYSILLLGSIVAAPCREVGITFRYSDSEQIIAVLLVRFCFPKGQGGGHSPQLGAWLNKAEKNERRHFKVHID